MLERPTRRRVVEHTLNRVEVTIITAMRLQHEMSALWTSGLTAVALVPFAANSLLRPDLDIRVRGTWLSVLPGALASALGYVIW
jgi:hypothetical protein